MVRANDNLAFILICVGIVLFGVFTVVKKDSDVLDCMREQGRSMQACQQQVDEEEDDDRERAWARGW